MKINYPKLNAAFIEMAKNMKSNGDCKLSANSLLDRFAKGLKLKSRQELKHNLSTDALQSSSKSTLQLTDTNEFKSLIEATTTYFADEYQGFFRSNEKLNLLINRHQHNALGIFISDEFYGDFFWDQFGLYATDFLVSHENPDLVEYAVNRLNDELHTTDLSASHYQSVKHLMAELVSKSLAEQLNGVALDIGHSIQHAYIANGCIWDEWIYEYTKSKIRKCFNGENCDKFIPEDFHETFKESVEEQFKELGYYPLEFTIKHENNAQCNNCGSKHGDKKYGYDACMAAYSACGLLKNGRLSDESKELDNKPIEYLCRNCCEQHGIHFVGLAENKIGRKHCHLCLDNSDSELHIK